MNATLLEKLNAASANLPAWLDTLTLPENIPHGDMPGDKVLITESHTEKAKKILPTLVQQMIEVLQQKNNQRCVIGVCGGSGVGKSETASLLGWYLGQLGAPCYILSGDNYPHRIPQYNDAERLRVFRDAGWKGLIAAGVNLAQVKENLYQLMQQEKDADPALCAEYPWLATYQAAGRCGLKAYLGTPNETDFERVNGIITQFQNGAQSIALKRMGRQPEELWAETVDFSKVEVLIIEWTHSNSDFLTGVDLPVLLNSTPEETMEHRRQRNRDGKVDSPFTTMVLEIEQGLLTNQAHKAKIILSKSCQLLSYSEFCAIMK